MIRKAKKKRGIWRRLFPVRRRRSKVKIKKERMKSRGRGTKHTFLVAIAGILLLLGAALTVYSLINKDLNSSVLGLAIMFFSLVTGLIITRAGGKRRRGRKKEERKREKKPTRIGFRSILYTIFLLIGLLATGYFYFLKKDFFLLAISIVIILLSIIGIVKSRSRRRIIGVVRVIKPEKVGEGKKVEEVKYKGEISKTEISKLKRIVKEKIKNLGREKTPLDVLYGLLEEKKKIKFPDIAEIFGIDIKKVDEQAKILETHDLAEIHYPAFGNPSLKLKVKVKEEEVKKGEESKKG